MANKAGKAGRTGARLPRGFVDRHPADIRAVDEMNARIREVYERYGFDPIETPLIEYTDALGKFLPDQDRPNEGVFSLQDDDEQWLSLRYDLTAPLARHVAENFNEIQLPYRTYRAGWVFRNEKPGPGRFRQFMQFDADTVGAPGVAADAEMCMMMADVMEALGIARGDYVIRVNNRKVLDGVMEAIGVSDEAQKLAVLRAIDKLDKFGPEGVKLLLGEGRWDGGREGEGDFTKGAGLDEEQTEKIVTVVAPNIGDIASDSSGDRQRAYLGRLNNIIGDSALGRTGLDELSKIMQIIINCGYAVSSPRIVIDPSVVRGLEYYTGPVFEAELLAEIPNEKGEIVRFGSVGGGGRYDGLVSRFRGQPVPATGFSIGVSRLATALKNLGKLGQDAVLPPVLVTVMDGDGEAMAKYQKFTQALRQAGIRAEMYQGNWKKFGNQLKYADRRGSPLAIIQGADERANGEVQIKDLIEGKRLSGEIVSNEEWREARVAQFSVKEDEIVEAVRKVLAAQRREREGA
ncbi:histidine--tRNA ligase [Nitratireductor sp. ZSWI3]|uniref:histidine--tRNA ligase n=1 Tax=Nitratireductor sp. ZSWI3 TaxID=2966359 RepID=UPI00214F72A8|nr:histidine--tRNA ligase [Nitratireductor sp. ZSWI3]MCR4269291.1 histidine--tRNA ligase [Nitratireductor sp. ZSWI3]